METENLVSPMPNQSRFKGALVPALAILLIIVAGGLTGRLLASRGGLSSGGGGEVVQSAKETGIKDEKTFSDTASVRI